MGYVTAIKHAINNAEILQVDHLVGYNKILRGWSVCADTNDDDVRRLRESTDRLIRVGNALQGAEYAGHKTREEAESVAWEIATNHNVAGLIVGDCQELRMSIVCKLRPGWYRGASIYQEYWWMEEVSFLVPPSI